MLRHPAGLFGAALASALVVAAVATAQPVTRPAQVACRVDIVVAPPAVRAAIEAWVRTEPRCDRDLVVRVVPVTLGYDLTTSDDEGRVRERIVPDAQSAAVLVVSWMADDSIGSWPAEAAPPAPLAPLAPPAPPAADGPPAIDPPVAAETDLELPPLAADRLARRAMRAAPRRWLTVGAIGASADRVGMRGQVDLVARRWWTIGLAGGWQRLDTHRMEDRGRGADGVADAAVVASATRGVGWIRVRAQLGLGAQLTGPTLGPALDAAVLAELPLGPSWGVTGGPVLAAPLADHGDVTLAVFLGVERRL